MSALRIAFFGSATRFSCLALESLANRGHVVGAVTVDPLPRRLRRPFLRLLGRPSAAPLQECAARLGIPLHLATDGDDPTLEKWLRSLRPDLICIAIFPKLLSQSVIGIAPLGAINAHPSLLPRHRGPLPLFWTYLCDDRETGVTVHHANARFDAGDVILQERLPLGRSYPVERLDAELSQRAASSLAAAVDQLAAGTAVRAAQDETAATHAPRIREGVSMVRFDEWGSERVWHFLGGLAPRYREPLADERGRPIVYDTVETYQLAAPLRPPGTVETVEKGWRLHCRDGIVMISKTRR